jgi:hypothetical protein
MATLPTCPKCGAAAASGRRSCATCGTSLVLPSPWVPLLVAVALLGLTALGGVLMWAARPLYEDGIRHAERVRTAQGTVIWVERHDRPSAPSGYRFYYTVKVVFPGPAGVQTFETGTYRQLAGGQSVTVYFDADNVALPSLDPPPPGAPLSRLIGFASGGLLLIVIGCGGLVGIARHLLRGRWPRGARPR